MIRNFFTTLMAIMVGLCLMVIIGYAINQANAGLWEKLSSMGDQTVQSTPFTIEAKGWDLRGYVFKPPKSDKECLFVAGASKGGLTCW